MVTAADLSGSSVAWWREPTKEQWLAWVAAWLGWTLDAFDFTMFLLIMVPISANPARPQIAQPATLANPLRVSITILPILDARLGGRVRILTEEHVIEKRGCADGKRGQCRLWSLSDMAASPRHFRPSPAKQTCATAIGTSV
jgi:hypothetical protein